MNENQKRKKISFEMYQKAMDEKAAKDQKQFKYVVMSVLLLFMQIIAGVVMAIFNSVYLTPFLIIAGSLWLVIFIPVIIKSFRCQKCGRFFPKGKLELIDSVKGRGEVWATVGEFQRYEGTTRVYWTECKYCGHIIWVLKGG